MGARLYSGLSVFDLDHTLLKANSSFRFGAYLYRRNFFSFFTLLYCLSYYARHKLFSLPIRELHQKIFLSLFNGCATCQIKQHVKIFLDQELEGMLYSPVIQRLKEAQHKGNYTVILSSSPDFLVQPIASHLGVNEWKASLYIADQRGRLKGISEIVEGQEKANYVHVLKERFNIPRSCITVYSDSYLDLPVLKVAGRPIAVSPDRYLRYQCLQNGWEIL